MMIPDFPEDSEENYREDCDEILQSLHEVTEGKKMGYGINLKKTRKQEQG